MYQVEASVDIDETQIHKADVMKWSDWILRNK